MNGERGSSIFTRTVLGFLATLLLGGAGAIVWNALLGNGIALRGQWDPTVGPVGPEPTEVGEGMLNVEQAYAKFEEGITQFVDARVPEDFAEGHIQGAVNLPALFDERDEFAPLFDEFQEGNQPSWGIPIIVYCSGADCDDSHTLRDKLLEREYYPVQIFFEGYPAWRDAGYPVEPEGAASATSYPVSRWRWWSFAGMVVALLFAIGAVASPAARKLWRCRFVAVPFRLILGGYFLYASIHKIVQPGEFAKQVYGYDLLPGEVINGFAMFLPWLEAVAGGLLIAGAFTRGAGLAIAGMLVVFLVAVGYNVSLGKEFDCGCFQTAEEGKVSDPIDILFRDAALLVLAVQILGVSGRHPGLATLLGARRGGSAGGGPG